MQCACETCKADKLRLRSGIVNDCTTLCSEIGNMLTHHDTREMCESVGAMERDPKDAELVVSPAAADAARRGHPWIWQNALLRGGKSSTAGDDVRVVAQDGTLVGHGIVDPGSPIFVRLWTSRDERIDEKLFDRRIKRALAVRQELFDDRTNAYRCIHGEGDRMPGFVVDRYADVAVLRTDGEGARAREDELVRALWPQLERNGVTRLIARDASKSSEARLLRGDPCPDRVEVREHGVPFAVDVLRGQKTGAFLDQRENRVRVGHLARGRRVLNLFSYAGGFSLHAALGGATKVTSVDIAANAHATAQTSFKLAGIDPRAHEFITADAFAFLAGAKKKGTTWDLIVSDPPSFAPNEKSLPRAMSAYRALHRACVEVMAENGVFCAASCSSHVDARAFSSTLDDGALGRDDLRLLELHGPPSDHPTLPGWPEGRYLKFAVLT